MLPEGKCRYIDGQIYPDGNFYVLDTQHIKHNGNELKSALNGINTDISNKVDKVAGKGLSTNDYTTAEKNKLSGIEANANDYVHPTTSGNKHIPSGGSSGKILGWSADGTAAWVDPASGDVIEKAALAEIINNGPKNCAPISNGSTSAVGYFMEHNNVMNIPSGTVIQVECDYTNASGQSQMYLTNSSGNNISAGVALYMGATSGHLSKEVTLPKDACGYRVYHNTASSATISNLMICTKTDYLISPDYAPYRPSYQELYDRIVALENS
jgi:hypothetical protein